MDFRVTFVLLPVIAVAGCASVPPQIRSEIVEFHSMRLPAPTDTFTVLPWRKELSDSLEFQTYYEQVANGMRARGYNVVQRGNPAKFVVFLDYGIDSGRTETSTYSIPQYGVTGYSGSTTRGTVNTYGGTSYFNATTTQTPVYGVTGYQQGVSSTQVFTRFVNMDIVELNSSGQESKKVYEGRLRSEGGCRLLPVVMPSLIGSLLTNFPGESGKSRREVAPFDPKYC